MAFSSCITVNNVTKNFGKHNVLNDISLGIQNAEIFGLLGPSGAGKTTLVKIIAGIDTATTGNVSVLGTEMPNLEIMKRIGYMAQSDALYEELTAKENLEFFGRIYGLKRTQRRQRIAEVMDIVGLTEDLNKKVNKYSGGMKRRLSLAAALLHRPELLILDEPTVGIDPVLRKSIWQELETLREQGTTILVTTHVMDEADKCQRLAMLRDGKLIAVGTPSELKESSSSTTLEEAFLTYGGAE
ncbi:ABC transporter ATP-binding protein [Pseudalkalibacillus caeni]|uniref:ABC transporter ATP-binding protein n=1 Tax=Exobacillus caeni TaxID=2574798 RepID=A0A5R9F5M0_9BACL|nr:ABC transporter ATP-binding protein [Pseudalkalibacillus caeni]TLS36113.1 ABC transporter ATP-binding protein [Pseudalkalibacillus caeni]